MNNLKSLFALFLLATLAFPGARAGAQANVIENQTNYLYVDATAGSDSNSGAQSSPLKTIEAAITKANKFNQAGVGTKVIVNPGVYRESVVINNYKETHATLTLEAATAGTAIIAGSDVVAGWTEQSDTVYSAPWVDSAPSCSLPEGWPTKYAPIAMRTEMVFVNGVQLTQVLDNSDLVPGTFYANIAEKTLYVAPPAGTDMQTATVEAAVRPETLNLTGRVNVALRGLVLRHAANCMNSASAVVIGSNNVLVDSVVAEFNNWGGFGVSTSTNVTVQNSISSYNGGVGFMGYRDVNILFNQNESDYNNWRGAQAAFYDWAMGGSKFFETHGATIENQLSYNNQAQALWFDTDNKNITINNASLSGSMMAALQIERNEGPITLENSKLCGSGLGLNALTSRGLTVENNLFYNNGKMIKGFSQIFTQGVKGGINIRDWQTGQNYDLLTTGMTLKGNTIVDATTGQHVFGTYLDASDFAEFATSLTAGDNTWYDSTNASGFNLLDGKKADLTEWQKAVQTDFTSVWGAPKTLSNSTCITPTPAYADFNIELDNNEYAMSSGIAVANVRVNSFNFGAVNLNVVGLPAGVTPVFSQPSLVSGQTTLTFVSSPNVVAETVPVTVWGASGSRVHSATIYLTVAPYTFSTPPVQPTATPTVSPAAGTYTSTQTVTLKDATAGANIYYTTDGSTPTTNSPEYTGPISVGSSETLKVIALAPGSSISEATTAAYMIEIATTPPPVGFSNGFSNSTGLQLNGKSSVGNDVLELTDGKLNEAASAFVQTPVNISSFTTTFTFQQTEAAGDGMMFVIQNAAAGSKALGPRASALGYSYGPTQAGAILNSVGIKFDLYSNQGEGPNSTGLYTNGAHPTAPGLDMTSSGVNLHSGHSMAVKLTYNGTVLNMVITDTVTKKSFTANWNVDIPQIVGAKTAYIGFTASTGGSSAIQDILNWTY